MNTPQKITMDEFRAQSYRYREEELLKPTRLPLRHICGTLLMHKDAYISYHDARFEGCAGKGTVEKLPIPYCPKCEQEPETHGCLHV